MDIGPTLLLAFIFGLILLLIQRSERRRRLVVFLTFLVVGEMIRRYAFFRDAHTEVWAGLIAALVLNGLFWLFIGRYNPPGSSEEIQVIGLDD
mgnify:CR=1 FL=1